MDARQLEYFLAVVDHNGFGRAAEALYIAQPSLSQTIGGLEHELGVQLFHRIGRGVVLSSAGSELIAPARQVLRDLRTARATIDAMKGLHRGRLELVTMPSPGIEPLSTLISKFTKRHPDVTVSTDAAFSSAEVLQQVKHSGCEIGVIGTPNPLTTPGVEVLPLEVQEFILVGATGADLPDDDPIRPSAMSGTNFIASPPGSLMRQVVDEALATATGVQIVAEVAHRTSILPLVMQGAGLAVLPAAWTSLAHHAGAQVTRIDHAARLHVALLTKPAPLTPPATAFLDMARSHIPGSYVEHQVT